MGEKSLIDAISMRRFLLALAEQVSISSLTGHINHRVMQGLHRKFPSRSRINLSFHWTGISKGRGDRWDYSFYSANRHLYTLISNRDEQQTKFEIDCVFMGTLHYPRYNPGGDRSIFCVWSRATSAQPSYPAIGLPQDRIRVFASNDPVSLFWRVQFIIPCIIVSE